MVLSKILAKIERMEIYLQISKGEDFHFLGTGTFKFSTEKWIVNKQNTRGRALFEHLPGLNIFPANTGYVIRQDRRLISCLLVRL